MHHDFSFFQIFGTVTIACKIFLALPAAWVSLMGYNIQYSNEY